MTFVNVRFEGVGHRRLGVVAFGFGLYLSYGSSFVQLTWGRVT